MTDWRSGFRQKAAIPAEKKTKNAAVCRPAATDRSAQFEHEMHHKRRCSGRLGQASLPKGRTRKIKCPYCQQHIEIEQENAQGAEKKFPPRPLRPPVQNSVFSGAICVFAAIPLAFLEASATG
ncbi:MAG TPA: hypothetical protein VN765_11625 [Candidatus Acidoferrum sp.]|nr:hypothetical protein [Candidatus Acidoferrum sp.]